MIVECHCDASEISRCFTSDTCSRDKITRFANVRSFLQISAVQSKVVKMIELIKSSESRESMQTDIHEMQRRFAKTHVRSRATSTRSIAENEYRSRH